MPTYQRLLLQFVFTLAAAFPVFAFAQSLDAELQRASLSDLAREARQSGDAGRGAVVFFQPSLACAKCHQVDGQSANKSAHQLGPDLTQLDKNASDEALIESVLLPSKVIRKGFESVTIVRSDGTTLSAMLVEKTSDKVVVKDIAHGGMELSLAAEDIDQIKANELSIMPAAQMNQLNSRQQFLDLMRYLMEIRDGGVARAKQLLPSPTLIALSIPEYESHLNHAGLIKNLNDESLSRGEAIYKRVCANCHGTRDQVGSLPTSLRFAEGKFKNGSDPLSMYRTLTYGFGLMAPQTWMVPSQKYDVIHYIRTTYLKQHNPSQFTPVDIAYLNKLPQGDSLGPEPSTIEAWSAMDYGPTLSHTYEISGAKQNFAYKGIAVRLDPGAGGVSRGSHWMVFDTDTLRTAGGWSALPGQSAGGRGKDSQPANANFIDWKSIQFNGEHGVHPHVVGKVAFGNSTGPGWANPVDGSFIDSMRVQGRDGKRYGPLPKPWGKFKGLYHHGQQAIFAYTIGDTNVLEAPRWQASEGEQPSLMLRTFHVGPRAQPLTLQVAEHPDESSILVADGNPSSKAVVAPRTETKAVKPESQSMRVRFDGETYLEIDDASRFETVDRDFTVVARIKTREDGSVWSKNEGGPKWTPGSQSLFIRDGKLCFDIGWVGAVSARTSINDDQWHTVAVTWQAGPSKVRLYVDGELDGEGILKAKTKLSTSVHRIGFTSPNFPARSYFKGQISQVRCYQLQLSNNLGDIERLPNDGETLVGHWSTVDATASNVKDLSKNSHDARIRNSSSAAHKLGPLMAGYSPATLRATWSVEGGKLRLHLPAGSETLRFSIWQPTATNGTIAENSLQINEPFVDVLVNDADVDLTQFTKGGPPRWPQKLTTNVVAGSNDGPLAIDVLTPPESNPWLAQIRFTGLDFFADGRMAVCSWDGDVWLVTNGSSDQGHQLHWQRIASGLFQPLGLKIVNEKIHVTCRDQLAVLHDLNADEEIDYYECLNSDHQVTEHFHEFAMGLQVDAQGNFYYAKSGCHGKAAIVPQHGTLLKVTPDGSQTQILANGFRAANGVCLNPDGSFVVTDQEGFWNPKNRINWVTLRQDGKPNFYGNMLGYHDVTDTSDAAMEQPLCWITNEFDRSPAELLWVDSERWGPLNGSLLNLSYGYGKVFLVLHEKVYGQMQGGMVELPIPAFPTGVMRGRFHAADGHLVLCGMFAWAGNATQAGGLYRIRATGKPICLPTELHATKKGLEIIFSEALDPTSIDTKQLSAKTWSLKRTANYGSKHYDERSLPIVDARLSKDGRTLSISLEDLRPTWCMELKVSARSISGESVQATIHNTIHELK